MLISAGALPIPGYRRRRDERGRGLDLLPAAGVKLDLSRPYLSRHRGDDRFRRLSPIRKPVLGAAAQIGIFLTFLVAIVLPQFNGFEAASIAIIWGYGPTAISLRTARPAHSGLGKHRRLFYMALVPVIQPPVIRFSRRNASDGLNGAAPGSKQT